MKPMTVNECVRHAHSFISKASIAISLDERRSLLNAAKQLVDLAESTAKSTALLDHVESIVELRRRLLELERRPLHPPSPKSHH